MREGRSTHLLLNITVVRQRAQTNLATSTHIDALGHNGEPFYFENFV